MTFCQICRHETPGHEENCPVLTGEPQRGWEYPYGINPQDMQPYPNPLNQIQQAQVQGQMGSLPSYYEPSRVGPIDERILVELQDIRAEIRQFKNEIGQLRAILKELRLTDEP